jgi:hypothetical protein
MRRNLKQEPQEEVMEVMLHKLTSQLVPALNPPNQDKPETPSAAKSLTSLPIQPSLQILPSLLIQPSLPTQPSLETILELA